MAYLEYFPEVFIELNKEIQQHDELQTLLLNNQNNDMLIKFAQVAAYCKVALDDTYTDQDLQKIAEILIDKLRAKRAIILVQ